jgi:peptidyl-prolyl cis-trans isomerase-like 3
MSVTFHTSLGDLKFEIFCDTAPKTSFNFLALCASNYYENSIFHRNMRGFMLQGGGIGSSGKGGESIWGGTFQDEFHPNNIHDKRGVLSMANKGPNTNAAQFFVTYERQPHLNNVYTVFGRLLEGWEVLDKMEKMPVIGGPKKSQATKPVDPPVIHGVTIHANPLADEGIVYPDKNDGPEKYQ